MFNKILFPTDGSSFTQGAMGQAIQVAKHFGASLVAFQALPRYRHPLHLDLTPFSWPTREEFEAQSRARAQFALDAVAEAAAAAGVPCKTLTASDQPVAEAIVQAARSEGCDLICMASHGEGGFSGAFLGSNASKVLVLSPLPVFVLR